MIDEEPGSQSSQPKSSKRAFPPLYKSAGDASVDRLAFVHILERLKVRTYLILLHLLSGFHLFFDRRKNALDGSIIM